MSFRSYANQAVQIGVETESGIAIPANKRLMGLKIDPTNSVETTQHKPSGYKVPTQSSLNTEKTEADYEGTLDYASIIYPLSSILGGVTPTQPDDVQAPNVYQWEWNFTGKDAIATKTYTMQVGDSERAVQFAGAAFRSMDIGLSRTGENNVSGSVIGRVMTTGAVLTADPDEVDIVPVNGTHLDVFADSSSASLGTTKLLKLFEGNFAIGDMLSEVYTINSTEGSYTALAEAEDMSFDLSMTLGADADAEAYFAKLRSGEKTFVRVKATGPEIAVGQNYSIELDMCVIVTGFDAYASNDGSYVLPVNFALAYDPTFGSAMKVRVINTVASL